MVKFYVTGEGAESGGGSRFFEHESGGSFFNINKGSQFSLMCINALKMGMVCMHIRCF